MAKRITKNNTPTTTAPVKSYTHDAKRVRISRPFPKPKTVKIAVKIINHYGDEVMKIVEIP